MNESNGSSDGKTVSHSEVSRIAVKVPPFWRENRQCGFSSWNLNLSPYQAIEKLNASNYNSWCDDVRVILLEKDCWDIVQGTENSHAEGATAKEVRDYRLRKSRAYSIIYLNTEKTHRPLISDTEDGRQDWKKLKQHFRPESRARAVALTDAFFSCKIQEVETIGLYAACLRQLVNQLKYVGAPIAEWYPSFQVIRYLPMEFSGIVQSIYRWEDKKVIFDNVVTELLAEESRLKQCQSDLDFIALESKLDRTEKVKLNKCVSNK
ncbi:hypothetical protein AVEN_116298-1, partial [Araneus ventricosus]